MASRRCLDEDHCANLLIDDNEDWNHAGDAFGHEAGDIALKNAVLALFANFRQADLIIRWGGQRVSYSAFHFLLRRRQGLLRQ